MRSHEETMALLREAGRGSCGAEETLISENLALVRSIVRRFCGRGVEYDDLFQLGCVGLVKAIHHFDTRFNVRFSTYAVPLIAGEIKRFLRDDGPVKVTRSLRELAIKAAAVREKLTEETGVEPGVCEIARILKASPEDVAVSLDALRQPVSLNEPLGEDNGETRGDHMAAPGSEDTVINRILTAELLNSLDERERRLILLRYFRDCTQTQVADKLGISQVQVSRLESRILKKMRQSLESEPTIEAE
jgi:RNA polymerase sporulation-specific sigma factor